MWTRINYTNMGNKRKETEAYLWQVGQFNEHKALIKAQRSFHQVHKSHYTTLTHTHTKHTALRDNPPPHTRAHSACLEASVPTTKDRINQINLTKRK